MITSIFLQTCLKPVMHRVTDNHRVTDKAVTSVNNIL